MLDAAKAKQEFLHIWQKVKRNGDKELIVWLEASGFFEAPASSKYHLCEPGGLAHHSVNVYRRLKKLLHDEYGDNCPYSEETIAIVALLHDLCKIDLYKLGWKNQKTYDPDKVAAASGYQVKHDAAGDFIWETVPAYTIEEDFVFGHGEKSVYLTSKFIFLSDEEAQAIRFHMGAWQDGDKANAGKAFGINPLAFFLHVADESATYLDEQ